MKPLEIEMVKKEKLTLDEHFQKCELDLFANKELFRYSDSNKYYKLIFDGRHFWGSLQNKRGVLR